MAGAGAGEGPGQKQGQRAGTGAEGGAEGGGGGGGGGGRGMLLAERQATHGGGMPDSAADRTAHARAHDTPHGDARPADVTVTSHLTQSVY